MQIDAARYQATAIQAMKARFHKVLMNQNGKRHLEAVPDDQQQIVASQRPDHRLDNAAG